MEAGGSWTAADVERMHHEQHGMCAYCSAPWEHVDHKTPLARGGDNWPSNLQLLCAFHNTSKGALTDTEYRSVHKLDLYLGPSATVDASPPCTMVMV